MIAMIFAAGIGSRLKPITDAIPKALVEVNGRTLLQYNIEQLKNVGVKHMVVNVHHFADQVIKFLKANNNFGVDIVISDERNLLLDTGGGLVNAAKYLDGNQPIILQNVDVFSNIDYLKMLNFHQASKALATLAVRNRLSSRYLVFNDNVELCGWKNVKTNEQIITRDCSVSAKNLAFSGIHILDPIMLNKIELKGVFSIIKAYIQLSEKYKIQGYIHDNNYWFDVGTLEKLESLKTFLQE